VDVFQLAEFEVGPEVEDEVFFLGGGDMDGIIKGLDLIDMGPEQETAVGETGDGDAGMMEGKQLFGAESFLAIEQVGIPNTQAEVDDGDYQVALQEHDGADAEEEDDFYETKEEVDLWQLAEDIFASKDEEEDIERDDQLAPEIKGMGLFAAEMTDGVGQDEDSGGKMEPGAATFEPFECRGDDGEGYGIHKKQFFLRYKNRDFP
jgi:hypothetical protein